MVRHSHQVRHLRALGKVCRQVCRHQRSTTRCGEMYPRHNLSRVYAQGLSTREELKAAIDMGYSILPNPVAAAGVPTFTMKDGTLRPSQDHISSDLCSMRVAPMALPIQTLLSMQTSQTYAEAFAADRILREKRELKELDLAHEQDKRRKILSGTLHVQSPR
jgi:hypothetical protein